MTKTEKQWATLDVDFPSELSRANNCICDACHDTNMVIRLKLPETKFFDGQGLSTKYTNYWLCGECGGKLLCSLAYPKEEPK